jgi:hypothetical protein
VSDGQGEPGDRFIPGGSAIARDHPARPALGGAVDRKPGPKTKDPKGPAKNATTRTGRGGMDRLAPFCYRSRQHGPGREAGASR